MTRRDDFFIDSFEETESMLEENGSQRKPLLDRLEEAEEEEKDYRKSAFRAWATTTTVSSLAAGKELLYDLPAEFRDYQGSGDLWALSDEVMAGAVFGAVAYYSFRKLLDR